MARIGVRAVALPAAHEAEPMWRSKAFGFAPMPHAQLAEARKTTRLLVFPGSAMLCKAPAARGGGEETSAIRR